MGIVKTTHLCIVEELDVPTVLFLSMTSMSFSDSENILRVTVRS